MFLYQADGDDRARCRPRCGTDGQVDCVNALKENPQQELGKRGAPPPVNVKQTERAITKAGDRLSLRRSRAVKTRGRRHQLLTESLSWVSSHGLRSCCASPDAAFSKPVSGVANCPGHPCHQATAQAKPRA